MPPSVFDNIIFSNSKRQVCSKECSWSIRTRRTVSEGFWIFQISFSDASTSSKFWKRHKNSERIGRRWKAVLLNCPALKTYVVFFERRKTSCSVLQRLRNVRNWFPQFWAIDTENERKSSSEHQWRRFMKKKLRNSICKRPLRSPGSAFELRWT